MRLKENYPQDLVLFNQMVETCFHISVFDFDLIYNKCDSSSMNGIAELKTAFWLLN